MVEILHAFRPYIRRYTYTNETFKHEYLHSNAFMRYVSSWSPANQIKRHIMRRNVTYLMT